jgi:hypothetical protein
LSPCTPLCSGGAFSSEPKGSRLASTAIEPTRERGVMTSWMPDDVVARLISARTRRQDGDGILSSRIGAWTMALALAAVAHGDAGMRRAATFAIGVGLMGAAGAAASGLTDWSETGGRARRAGLVHGLLNAWRQRPVRRRRRSSGAAGAAAGASSRRRQRP